jgi:hypothetical protein
MESNKKAPSPDKVKPTTDREKTVQHDASVEEGFYKKISLGRSSVGTCKRPKVNVFERTNL